MDINDNFWKIKMLEEKIAQLENEIEQLRQICIENGIEI